MYCYFYVKSKLLSSLAFLEFAVGIHLNLYQLTFYFLGSCVSVSIDKVIQMWRPSIHLKVLVSLHFFWPQLSFLPLKMPLQLQEQKWVVMTGFLWIIPQHPNAFGWLVWMSSPHHLLALISTLSSVFDAIALFQFSIS